MTTKARPRLGRGLSALLSNPVSVDASGTPTPDESPVGLVSVRSPGFQLLLLESIVPGRFQPRQDIDEAALARLVDSVKASGVMQPIAVRRASTDAATPWELVAGERRWRAAQRAGLTHIPAVIVELNDRDAAEWGVVENLQREDLNPMERAWAFRRLVEDFKLSHEVVATRVGVDRSTVSNLIRLTDLESEIQDQVAAGELSTGHAKAILAMPSGPLRIAIAARTASEGWSVRRLEHLIRGKAQKSANAPTEQTTRNVNVGDLERQLSEHLGTKVRISTDRSGSRGRVSLHFYDAPHFDSIMSKLGITLSS